MAIPETAKTIAKKVGEYTALLAVFGVVGSLWINTEVERRMKELAKDPSVAPVVVELRADMDNMEAGQVRIEDKVDAFSTEFMKYLQRQAAE